MTKKTTRLGSRNLSALGSATRKHQRVTAMQPRIWKVQPRMRRQGTHKEQSTQRISMGMKGVRTITINNVAIGVMWLNHDPIAMWW